MTRNLGGVGLLQNVRPQYLRNMEAVGRTGTGTWLPPNGDFHPLLDVSGQSGNNSGRRKGGNRTFSRALLFLELLGQGVCLNVVRTRVVGEDEVDLHEQKRPAGLTGIKLLGL